MLYRIDAAIPHENHTVTITWSDGMTADVDLSPVIARGRVFAAMRDGRYFVDMMRIAQRTARGRADAKANGVRFGRKPILTPHQQKEARKRVEAGEPQCSIALSFNVSQATISRLSP